MLTAVGMVRPEDYEHHWAALAIMITAVVLAIAVMIAFSGPIANFVNQHLSVKMLALLVPDPHRRRAGRRRPPHARPRWLHLLLDGLLADG